MITVILIAETAGAPMRRVREARAVAGAGLEGDRYAEGVGSFSRWPGAHRALTLIAEEALAAFEAETGVALTPEEARRNVVVRGVPLNNLVGARFWVGEVEVEGSRLCQPCKMLARRTGKPAVLPERSSTGVRLKGPGAHSGLIGKGGLRVAVLTSGTIRIGDAVVW
jgi:MOSC domain-containing protein YiiM